ncbi:MAG: hypothetical protein ABSG15_00495 [FCB group bacterium]|jgi:hypothetical protein
MKNYYKIPLLLCILILISDSNYAQEKYLLSSSKILLEVSRDTALAQVGTLEKTGNNDGEVEKYQKAVGLKRGDAYCAAGQYWCFLVSADALGLNHNEIPIKRTGVANLMFNDAKQRGSKTSYKATMHDLLVWRKRNTNSGHIERIINAGKAGWVLTVGFNTGSGKPGSACDGVYLRKRNILHPLGRMAVRGLIGFNIK